VTLHSVRDRALWVAPIRIGLGVAWLVAGRLAGVASASAWIAFAAGAFVTALVLFNDPRSRFFRRHEPQPVPAGAEVAPRWRQALSATLPSTLGVNVLAAIAFASHPGLSVLLGGVSAGLGVAGAAFGLQTASGLLVEPRSGDLYRR
jgi:hypothetical protein